MKNDESKNLVIQVKDINVGANIRELREAAAISQVDMVKKLQLLGIDISTYSYNRIEKGTQNPAVSFLLACCKILDCDMNKIFKMV